MTYADDTTIASGDWLEELDLLGPYAGRQKLAGHLMATPDPSMPTALHLLGYVAGLHGAPAPLLDAEVIAGHRAAADLPDSYRR